MPTKTITTYDIIKSIIVNHHTTEISLDKFLYPFKENGGYVQSETAKLLVRHIEELYYNKLPKASSKTKKPKVVISSTPVPITYNDLLEHCSIFLKIYREVTIEEFALGLQNETVYLIRRFLYSRGLRATYKSHSLTKDPLAQFLHKILPEEKTEINKTHFTINTKSYPLNENLVKYVETFDNTFPAHTIITRNQAIKFIEGFIRDLYKEDER